MTTYTIETSTPATPWRAIHTGYDLDGAIEFLKEMSAGGYDHSGTDGSFDGDGLTAYHYDGGDLVEFRAVAEEEGE